MKIPKYPEFWPKWDQNHKEKLYTTTHPPANARFIHRLFGDVYLGLPIHLKPIGGYFTCSFSCQKCLSSRWKVRALDESDVIFDAGATFDDLSRRLKTNKWSLYQIFDSGITGGQIFPDKFSSCWVPSKWFRKKNRESLKWHGDSLRVFQDLGPPPFKGKGPGRSGEIRVRFPPKRDEPREGRGMEELQSGWIFIQRQHQRLSPGQRIPGPHFFSWGWGVFTLKVQTKKSGLEKHENIWKHHFRRDWWVFLFVIEKDVVCLKPFCLRWEGSSMGEGFALSWASTLAYGEGGQKKTWLVGLYRGLYYPII